MNMRDSGLIAGFSGTRPDRPGSTGLGRVTLIGAGPGDPDLLTLKAYRALQSAEVVLYDHLVSQDILGFLPETTERIYVGKESSHHSMPQERIGETLVCLAKSGRHVVRLKGGDGYIFGRGGEEAQVLAHARVPFDVIPGITSAQGAAASTGIPLTHRDHARALILATGHLRDNKQVDLDWEMLARPQQTVVIYMGIGTLPIISQQLMSHGLAPSTPAALIERATTAAERCLVGTIKTLPELAIREAIKPPALIVIGEVVNLRGTLVHDSDPIRVSAIA